MRRLWTGCVLVMILALSGCMNPPTRSVDLAPPEWLQGTWRTSFDLACFDITSTDIVWHNYEGYSSSVRYDFEGSITDSAPTDQYYVVYTNGRKALTFTRLTTDMASVWMGPGDPLIYTRK